jgi:hypothetical protein
LLEALFSVCSVSYLRKVGDLFLTELLVNFVGVIIIRVLQRCEHYSEDIFVGITNVACGCVPNVQCGPSVISSWTALFYTRFQISSHIEAILCRYKFCPNTSSHGGLVSS